MDVLPLPILALAEWSVLLLYAVHTSSLPASTWAPSMQLSTQATRGWGFCGKQPLGLQTAPGKPLHVVYKDRNQDMGFAVLSLLKGGVYH